MTDNIHPLIQAQADIAQVIAAEVERFERLELELGELHEIIGNADRRGLDGSFAERLRALLAVQWSPGNALQLVADERLRQLVSYSEAHDDEHTRGELAIVAAELALDGTDAHIEPGSLDDCGMHRDYFGLVRKQPDEVRRLVIAAALLVAEIERLHRQSAQSTH